MHKAKTQCFIGREIYKNSGTSVNFETMLMFFKCIAEAYKLLGSRWPVWSVCPSVRLSSSPTDVSSV